MAKSDDLQTQTRNFLFSGSAVASVAAASSWLPTTTDNSSLQLVALAGVSNLICNFEGTNDPATIAGTASNVVRLGTITLTAAGSDGMALGVRWVAVRANIATLNGGNAQAYMCN